MSPQVHHLKNGPAVNVSFRERELLCVNGTPWIWDLLEECVENVWQHLSVIIGLVSIFCFLFAALPQLYEAYRNGKVDQALSLGFLLCWLVGDFTNMIGCYLTNQLSIQIVTAIFYINMDIIMISQFAYYKLKNRKEKTKPNLKWFCVTWVVLCMTLSVLLPGRLLLRTPAQRIMLQSKKDHVDSFEMSGYICGYISCVFYLGSRFPQLYKNFQRKSTEGTSYFLFALAMMGNFTYGLSIVIKALGIKEPARSYILHHLAWLIGSFGVLFLDFFVTAQFIMYHKHRNTGPNLVALEKVPEVEPLLEDEEEEEEDS